MAPSIKIRVDKSGLSKKIKEIQAKAVSREVLTEIGETVVRLNRKNARTGKAADGSSFPPLSEGWKDYRHKLSKVNNTQLAYGRGRSNVTFSGQLVDAIEYEIDEVNKSVTIQFSDTTREQYRGLRGGLIGDPELTNRKLSEYFKEKGVSIIGFNKEMRERVNFILTSAVRRLLKSSK